MNTSPPSQKFFPALHTSRQECCTDISFFHHTEETNTPIMRTCTRVHNGHSAFNIISIITKYTTDNAPKKLHHLMTETKISFFSAFSAIPYKNRNHITPKRATGTCQISE